MNFFGIFIIALLMALVFAPYKKNDSLMPLVILFALLSLSGLTAHYWIVPFGPRIWGVSWLPVLVMMFVFGLLFSSPRRKKAPPADTQVPVAAEAIGLITWILLFILLTAVITGIYHTGTLA